MVRGWTDDDGVIDRPLALDSTGDLVDALTSYRTHARIELKAAVGKRHATARYSLVEARPETGRFHQIRRHMAGLSHPLIGDCAHGDSHHNRFFRVTLDLPGLWLKAKAVSFAHPVTGENICLVSAWSERWLRLFKQLEIEVPK
jgi:tRNA pseudouridine65 synthase